MNIPKEIVQQFSIDCQYPTSIRAAEYIAQRAADYALEQAAKVCERARETIWEYHPDEVKAASCNVCTNLALSLRKLKEVQS